ncbi:hypothetical protein BDD12DRAFT_806787 [Trichophaea hybrida]|nr:hypothetical protein BDD12DRAFT_806787 [Trichophaea hybrida]
MAKRQSEEGAEKSLAAKVLPILDVVINPKTSKLTDETIRFLTSTKRTCGKFSMFRLLKDPGSLWPESTSTLLKREPSDRFGTLASPGALHVTFPGIKLGTVKAGKLDWLCIVPNHHEEVMYGVVVMEELTCWSLDHSYGIISSAPIHVGCEGIANMIVRLTDKEEDGIIEIERWFVVRLKPLRNITLKPKDPLTDLWGNTATLFILRLMTTSPSSITG